MCGRYVRRSDKQRVAEWFHVSGNLDDLPMPEADYNIAPTTRQPIIRQRRETRDREIVLARWGLIPFFTKDVNSTKGVSTINARAETITTAKTWREPVKKRRCLVPASAFYEWPKQMASSKQPYIFELGGGGLFAFAGLWDAWQEPDGHWLQSYAIVTTAANELMSTIHPRMPVILRPNEYDRWLDREETERLPLDLLRPYDSNEMEMHKANPQVNNVRNNGPEMQTLPNDRGPGDLLTANE
jgi:putative SOS response-associated peptidase YedK